EMLGGPVERNELTQTFIGGGFGRKSVADYVLQAVEIARIVGAPIQLIWSREQDIQHDHYRPAYLQMLKAKIGPSGSLPRLHHDLAGPPVLDYWRPEAKRDPIDWIAIAGSGSGLYSVP